MTDSMRAVGFRENLPADDPSSLVDLRLPIPAPGPHDLLVRVHAASVNPVDTKIRRFGRPHGDEPRILGFDAAGVVVAIGSEVSRFAAGDDVFYAGVTNRAGSNAEFQLVDERIVGRKPATLDFAQAASLPLTTITAWESLFDHLALGLESTGTILVVGAAGGAGSMATQLARTQTRLEVVATASRPESAAFALELGAHHVVDHTARFVDEVAAIAPDGLDYIFSAYSPQHVKAYAELVRPLGHIVAIGELDVLQQKSITWHFELMFTRPPVASGRLPAPSAGEGIRADRHRSPAPDSHSGARRPPGGDTPQSASDGRVPGHDRQGRNRLQILTASVR